MKKKLKGTPTRLKKVSKVSAIRKIFEDKSSSQRLVEQLQQPSSRIKHKINLNPDQRESTRQTRDICVGQPGDAKQTGPRWAEMMAGQLGHDWATKTGTSHPEPIASHVTSRERGLERELRCTIGLPRF